MPVHFPVDGSELRRHLRDGRRDRRSANSPAFSTAAIAGEFSVRNTSAGDAAPSATIWLPSSVSPPWRQVTLMPVSLVNASIHSWVSDSCWAL